MKILVYKFFRAAAVAKGWEPSWGRYCYWLKERKRKQKKAELEAQVERDRREHNDKVLRQYGLGKYQRKGEW